MQKSISYGIFLSFQPRQQMYSVTLRVLSSCHFLLGTIRLTNQKGEEQRLGEG